MFAATPPGFKNAPISKLFITITVSVSIISSIAGIKHYFFLQLVPHIWRWGQWWRLIVWQFVYLNESEVLFASLLVYNLRVIERMLGSRKYASMMILSYAFTFLLAPCILIFLKIVPSYSANYLPPGPTPIIFAALALYHDMIPSVYKFRISSGPPSTESAESQSSSSSEPSSSTSHTITLSDKIFVYILSVQVALAQMPGSLICAFTGWLVGVLWTREVLPGRNWRIPEWWWERTRTQGMASLSAFGTGQVTGMGGANTETAGAATGGGGGGEGGQTAPTDTAATQGRGFGSQILDTFRGNF
ncbi:hypothetical protein V1523DRAFT_356089 [Lipomyces doorenjongii]